jgi:hypothetical protein
LDGSSVPSLVDSGLTFPLAPDMGYGMAQAGPVVTHQFGSGDAKIEQRFAVHVHRVCTRVPT